MMQYNPNNWFRGITFIMQAIIFRIVPTALEISLVCGILVCPTIGVTAVACLTGSVRLTNSAGISLRLLL